jgi:predicted RNA-binding protein with PUA-like domain
MKYWLIKSEGDCYSIDDFRKDRRTSWTGIRNYQARNYMQNDMQKGDLALFYHSNGTKENPMGVYGVAKVISSSHVDETQFDKNDQHYDPKSAKNKPIWFCVDFSFVSKFKKPITLNQMKIDPALEGMLVLKKGIMLSVQPVSEKHFRYIESLNL